MYRKTCDNTIPFHSRDYSLVSESQKLINHIKSLNCYDNSEKDNELEIAKLVWAMRQLFDQAIADGKFFPLLTRIIDSPQNWLTDISVFNPGNIIATNTYLLAGLFECACQRTMLFDRLQTIRRFNNENTIIKLARQIQYDPQYQRFNYLSLGAGGCLQELALVIRLIKSGICNINMHLIEPKLSEQAPDRSIIEAEQNFRYIINKLNEELNVAIYVYTYPSLSSCLNQITTQFHLITAVDFDELPYTGLPDVLLCQQSLTSQGGVTFISWLYYDFTLFSYHGSMHRHNAESANYYVAGSQLFHTPQMRYNRQRLKVDTGIDSTSYSLLKASKADHKHLNILIIASNDIFEIICELLLPYLYEHPQAKHTQLTLAILTTIDPSIRPEYLQPFLTSLLQTQGQTITVQPIVRCVDYFDTIPTLESHDIVMFQPDLFETDKQPGSLFACLSHHFPNAVIVNVEDSASSEQQLLPNPFAQGLRSD